MKKNKVGRPRKNKNPTVIGSLHPESIGGTSVIANEPAKHMLIHFGGWHITGTGSLQEFHELLQRLEGK